MTSSATKIVPTEAQIARANEIIEEWVTQDPRPSPRNVLARAIAEAASAPAVQPNEPPVDLEDWSKRIWQAMFTLEPFARGPELAAMQRELAAFASQVRAETEARLLPKPKRKRKPEPHECPIGMGDNPSLCSAGTCYVCISERLASLAIEPGRWVSPADITAARAEGRREGRVEAEKIALAYADEFDGPLASLGRDIAAKVRRSHGGEVGS